MIFTERLNQLLREKHLTRKQFLDDLHFGKNQFTYWEKNQTVPNRSTLDAIATYFGVSADYLLGNSPAVQNENETKISWDLSEQEKTLVELFRGTTEEGRFEIIAAVMNIIKEKEKKVTAENTECVG